MNGETVRALDGTGITGVTLQRVVNGRGSSMQRRHSISETSIAARASHVQEDISMMVIVLFTTYLLISGLFIGLAVPLVQGRVKPNPWYGFRVRKTLENPDTWYAVNAYFGRRFAVVGLLVAVSGVMLLPLALIPHVGAIGYMMAEHTLLIFSLIWITVDTFRYLRKY